MGGQTFDYPGEGPVGDLERKVASGAAQPRVIRDILALRQTLRMAVESLTERLRMADEDILSERGRNRPRRSPRLRRRGLRRSSGPRQRGGRWDAGHGCGTRGAVGKMRASFPRSFTQAAGFQWTEAVPHDAAETARRHQRHAAP